jgi:tight adherence protein B
MSSTWAVVATAAAVWFAFGSDPARRLHGQRAADGADGVPGQVRRGRPGEARRVAVLAGAGAAALSALWLGPGASAPAGVVAAEVVRRSLAARRHRRADSLRAAVPDLCIALAAELQAGRSPAVALAAATEAAPPSLVDVCAPIVSVAALAGDVPAALRFASSVPGAEGLRHIAACWSVSGEVGAGLAAALHRLGAGLRASVHLRRQIDAHLAGARATGRLLAVLPLLGLGLGAAIGGAPGYFLLHTPAGAVCLALAVALDIAGLAWMDRIAVGVLSAT